MKRGRDPIARVRAIALKLPDVEEGTTFGYPAFKVAGRTFAWFPKKAEVEMTHANTPESHWITGVVRSDHLNARGSRH